MSCTTLQDRHQSQVLSTIPMTATTAIPIELGTYVPTVQCHCVLNAGTKAYEAHAIRPDGWFTTMSRSL